MNSEVFSVRIPYTFIGNGAVNNVGKLAKEFGAKKVLLITDQGVVKAGLADKVKQLLEEEGNVVVIADHVEPDNPIKGIEKSARVAKEGGCDLMIGLGGGSVMDNAKLASILVTADDISKEDVSQWLGTDKITRRGMPKILIPTTSGTGAEWTQPAAITLEGRKMGIRSAYLLPEAVIVDPLMTLNLPQKVTADTGMDALSHAVEVYTGLRANLFSDMMAEKAISLIGSNLRAAYAMGPNNVEARYNMSFASMIACNPLLVTGAHLGHGLAHSLQSVVHNTTHGITCSLMMCPVMEFNLMATMEKQAKIAELMGENIDGLSLKEGALCGIEAVRQLSIDVGMPQRLRDIGLKKEDIQNVVDILFKYQMGLVNNNPRRCSREEAIKILESVW
jgi:alcohol dehydrogenase class IV